MNTSLSRSNRPTLLTSSNFALVCIFNLVNRGLIALGCIVTAGIGLTSSAIAQEFEFRERFANFLDYEGNMEGFCVRIDMLQLRIAPDQPAKTEAQSSYLVVDRLDDAIRLDTRVTLESEDGQSSSESYRYLRRRDEVYFAEGSGPLFHSAQVGHDVMQSLVGRPNNPFEAIFCGSMLLPDVHWKQSMRGIESFFNTDKISATRFEGNKVIGLVHGVSGHTVCEIEFDLKSPFGLNKITTYVNHPNIDLERPSRNTVPYMVTECKWQPYHDIFVPRQISTRLTMGTRNRQLKTETEIYYTWFDGNVPEEVLLPDGIATSLDRPTRLQQLLDQ